MLRVVFKEGAVDKLNTARLQAMQALRKCGGTCRGVHTVVVHGEIHNDTVIVAGGRAVNHELPTDRNILCALPWPWPRRGRDWAAKISHTLEEVE